MIEQYEQAIVDKLNLLVGMAGHVMLRVAGDMRCVSDALSVLARELEDLNSSKDRSSAPCDAIGRRAMNDLMAMAATACGTVDEALSGTRRELRLALSLADDDVAGSLRLTQLRHQASETLAALSDMEAAASTAIRALAVVAHQLQTELGRQIAEQLSRQQTQALIRRLTSVRRGPC